MKKSFSCLFLLLIINTALYAQEKYLAHARPSSAKRNALNGNEPTSAGNSNTGSNIDVVYHRADWTVDPNNGANISGVVTTYFKTIQPNVSAISFDFIKASFENSVQVQYHGINCSTFFPSSGNVNILNITLPAVINAANTLDSVTITYSAKPVWYGCAGICDGNRIKRISCIDNCRKCDVENIYVT